MRKRSGALHCDNQEEFLKVFSMSIQHINFFIPSKKARVDSFQLILTIILQLFEVARLKLFEQTPLFLFCLNHLETIYLSFGEYSSETQFNQYIKVTLYIFVDFLHTQLAEEQQKLSAKDLHSSLRGRNPSPLSERTRSSRSKPVYEMSS